jgi:hypothetical protein
MEIIACTGNACDSNGVASLATFYKPMGLAVMKASPGLKVLFADSGNDRIKAVTCSQS